MTVFRNELCAIYDSRQSFYHKAIVEHDDSGVTLYSYGLPVCMYDLSGNFKKLWGGYSATTMRHINEFIKQYGTTEAGGKAWWDSLEVAS